MDYEWKKLLINPSDSYAMLPTGYSGTNVRALQLSFLIAFFPVFSDIPPLLRYIIVHPSD